MAKKPTKTEQALAKESARQAGEPKTVPGGAPIEGRTNFTAPGKVKKLAKDLRGLADDIAEIRGEMGGLVTDATQNHHLHKKAFSGSRTLLKMSAEKLAEYLEHRAYYEDHLGITDKAKSAPRFAMGDSPAEKSKNGTGKNGTAKDAEKGVEAKAESDNVTTFPGSEARPH